MKALVFGSRTLRSPVAVRMVLHGLKAINAGHGGLTVVCGVDPDRPRGVDGHVWDHRVEVDWLQVRPYPAEWKVHAEGWCPGPRCAHRLHRKRWWCVAAGPRRNQRMIDEEHLEVEPIDLGVGIVDKPIKASRGSFDMRSRLWKARIPVVLMHVPPPISDSRVKDWVEPPVVGPNWGQAPAWSRELIPGVVPTEP